MNRALSTILRAAIIAGAVWFVYAPAFHGGWFWDDPAEIVVNASIRTRAGLLAIWTAPGTPDYYPLKQTLQWVQWHLWGQDVTGYHLTNVALHLFSCLLFWRILSRLGARQAWLGGLLFAIHPVAVESVAWISELKNVLSLPLMLMAFLAYLNWDEGETRLPGASLTQSGHRLPSAPMRRAMEVASHLNGSYTASLLLFLAAMLCKSSVVMFPFVLLLYAWWRRGRVGWRDALSIAPFLAVSLALGLVTMWFQAHRAIAGEVILASGLLSRLAVAGMAVAFYFWKALVPVGLMPIYPRWRADPPDVGQFWPWIVLAAALFCLWRLRDRAWARHAAFGLGFFLINLAPVLGFVPMSFLRLAWVSDHFAYVSLLGLAGLAAAGIDAVLGEREGEVSGFGTAARLAVLALVVALAAGARSYAGTFAGPKTLWTYNVGLNPGAWAAYNNLGNALFDEGRFQDAAAAYEAALRVHPDYPEAHNNVANILAESGRPEEAYAHYQAALRIKPDYGQALNGLANLLFQTGHTAEAVEKLESLVRIRPDFAEAQNNLGNILFQMGRYPEAEQRLREALRARPAYAQAHNNLGNVMVRTGRLESALAEYTEALGEDPGYPEALNNLGNAQMMAGRLPEAIATLREAIRVRPRYAEAHYNLSLVLAATGHLGEAIAEAREALEINPGFQPARAKLDQWSALSGKRPAEGAPR